MSINNIGFYEDLTKIILELSSNIIKYAPYFFCCAVFRYLMNTCLYYSVPPPQLLHLGKGTLAFKEFKGGKFALTGFKYALGLSMYGGGH